jgi:hypothetical protein
MGSRRWTKICHLLAASDRITAIASGHGARRPPIVVTSTGKKQIRADMATLLAYPLPIQRTSSGAIAMSGIVFNAMA